jgi:hypothetical protein
MKNRFTIDELIAAWGPIVQSLPANKPRDPKERELLLRLGDPVVLREDPSMTRIAGERFTPKNSGPRV